MYRYAVSISVTVALAAGLPACVKRLPAAAGDDRRVVAGEEVAFGQPVDVPEGASVVWRMGDGTRKTGAQVRHAWQRPGTFRVAVEVTDPDGQQRRSEADVEVTRPALLEVVPASSRSLVWFDSPGERLKSTPLLLERLLTSGDEVNSLLAMLRHTLGFDPFTAEGLSAAGLDPEGGLAAVALPGRDDPLVVAAVLPGDAARDTLRRLVNKMEDAREQLCERDMGVIEVRSANSKELLAAYTFFRGHLWVSLAADDQRAAVQALVDLRRAGLQPGLRSVEAFSKAHSLRPEPGSILLYSSAEAMLSSGASTTGHTTGRILFYSSAEAMASDAEAAGQLPELGAAFERLSFLRLDLDLKADAVAAELRLGVRGQEAKQLAGLLRARNPVPAFRRMVADERHLVVKLSADWFGLFRLLAQLGGEKAVWDELNRALDALGQRTGIALDKGVVENLGDSLMLSARLKPAGILRAVDRQGGPIKLEQFLEGVLCVQLRDADLFFRTLEGLGALEGAASAIAPVGDGTHNAWRIGPAELGLVMGPAKGMVLVATSNDLYRRARDRVANPAPAPADWPEALEAGDQQVLAVDLGRLIRELTSVRAQPSGGATALLLATLKGSVERFKKLDTAVVRAVLNEEVLTLTARFGLR